MNVKIVNKSNNELPKYATKGSAGFDFRSNVNMVLEPGEYKAIPTGLSMRIPEGYELQVRPRSGLALKNGITVFNSPGTIDSDFSNEIMIILINHSKVNFIINVGDRIAQGIISKHENAEWILVDELEETERIGGFGSTGLK